MLSTEALYIDKAARQRAQRRQRKKACMLVLNKFDHNESSSSTDDDSMNSNNNNSSYDMIDQEELSFAEDDTLLNNYEDCYGSTHKLNHDNSILDEDFTQLSFDTSLPLYNDSPLSVKATAISIMSFAIDFNLSKVMVEGLLKLLKSFLPVPNLLPTTYCSITKVVNSTPDTSSKYYCNTCYTLCTERAGKKFCENAKCTFKNNSLKNRNISEIIVLDLKSQLKRIISCNSLLFSNDDYLPAFDINSGLQYQKT